MRWLDSLAGQVDENRGQSTFSAKQGSEYIFHLQRMYSDPYSGAALMT